MEVQNEGAGVKWKTINTPRNSITKTSNEILCRYESGTYCSNELDFRRNFVEGNRMIFKRIFVILHIMLFDYRTVNRKRNECWWKKWDQRQ